MNAQYDHRGARIRLQPTPNQAADQAMSAGRLLRLQIAQILTTLGAAQNPAWTIQSPVDWPVPTTAPADKLPFVGVNEGGNDKTPTSPGPQFFTTVVHIELVVRTKMFNDRQSAQDAVDSMEYLIEKTLFTDYALIRAIQRFASWNAQKSVDAEGAGHMGALTVKAQLELPEEFNPAADA